MDDVRYVLAIDHGTSGIKAAIVSSRGEVVDHDFERTSIRFFERGGAEQEPEDWWGALTRASTTLIRRARVRADEIAAVSVSSTFSTTVAVDENGAPLLPALTWMDSRGAPYIRRVMGGLPSFQGYNLVRAWKWIRKAAGAPSLSGKDDAAHVLLVKHEHPDTYRRTHAFLPSKDYLNFRLTGRMAASYDSVHLFWATDARDPNDIRYDEELLGMLGIERAKLPALVGSTEILGKLRPESARELGLPEGLPVVAGSPDHQCALVGSGGVADYDAHLYVGTSSWIECPVPFQRCDPLHSVASFPTALPGRYQCINEQDVAGGALSFLADTVLFRRADLKITREPEDPYALVEEIASSVAPGSGRLLFTPWLNGERTPVDDPHLRGGFHNLSATTTIDQMVRAVLEGVAYNTRWALGYVEKFVGRRLDPIRIIGGGAQSDVWCQIFADVCGREIRRVADPRQANARGAAFIAAVGCGWLRFDDVPGLVPCRETFRPAPDRHAVYDELYDAFLHLHRRNAAVYRRLNG